MLHKIILNIDCYLTISRLNCSLKVFTRLTQCGDTYLFYHRVKQNVGLHDLLIFIFTQRWKNVFLNCVALMVVRLCSGFEWILCLLVWFRIYLHGDDFFCHNEESNKYFNPAIKSVHLISFLADFDSLFFLFLFAVYILFSVAVKRKKSVRGAFGSL